MSVGTEASPVFRKFYKIPYSLEERLKTNLNKLKKQGVIEPVMYSEWITTIMVIPKKQGTKIRLYSDFKVTVNKYIKKYAISSTYVGRHII